MPDRFERPIKILCLGLALLLVWQLGGMILGGNPLRNIKIPPLPKLAGDTNEISNAEPNQAAATNVPPAAHPGAETNLARGTNSILGTNIAEATNSVKSTNAVTGTNVAANALHPSAAGAEPQGNAGPRRHRAGPGMGGMNPAMMAAMMGGGGMGGAKPVQLPPEVEARVGKIIDSEILGSIMHPMPMELDGISEQSACIRSTTGQTDWVKVGSEFAGIKLLRVGINRVLVEEGGEMKELTQFGGVGGESLMPPPTNLPPPSVASTNAPSTNAPAKNVPVRNATDAKTNETSTLSAK